MIRRAHEKNTTNGTDHTGPGIAYYALLVAAAGVAATGVACTDASTLDVIGVAQRTNSEAIALVEGEGADPLVARLVWSIPTESARDLFIDEGESQEYIAGVAAEGVDVTGSLPAAFTFTAGPPPEKALAHASGAYHQAAFSMALGVVAVLPLSAVAALESGTLSQLADETPIGIAEPIVSYVDRFEANEAFVLAPSLGFHLSKSNPDPEARACHAAYNAEMEERAATSAACAAEQGCEEGDDDLAACLAPCQPTSAEPQNTCAPSDIEVDPSETMTVEMTTLGALRATYTAGLLGPL